MTEPAKLLIVEDELLIAEDLKQKLESLGYEVQDVVPTGEEAIATVNRDLPDIAILDINIDGEMDGLQVGSYIKSTKGIPIIYLTQYQDLQTFDKAKAIQPSSYLTKPVNIWDLVRAIELSLTNQAVATSKSTESQSFLLNKALYLRSGEQRFERVDISQILFLRAAGAYTEVHTEGKKFTFSENLSHFEKVLMLPNLIRVHRSWMINIDKVDSIEDMVLTVSDERIPVGKTYRKLIKQHFKMI